MTINSKLKYNEHVTALEKKLAHLAAIVKCKRYNFSLHIAKLFYYGYVYSTLSYNIAIWGGSLLVYQLARLRQLHEKIIYSLFSYHARSTDINEIHRCIGVLKIDDIYRYHAMIYMFNIANCNVQSLLYGFQENMGRRNRFTGALRIPIPKMMLIGLDTGFSIPAFGMLFRRR